VIQLRWKTKERESWGSPVEGQYVSLRTVEQYKVLEYREVESLFGPILTDWAEVPTVGLNEE